MHRLKLFLLLLIIPITVFAAATPKTEVVLIGHVTQRVSGTAVVVDGYRFYASKTLGTYPSTAATTVPENVSEILSPLKDIIPPPASGNYYIVVTAYISSEESSYSNFVPVYAVGDGTFFIAAPLDAPGALQLR